jgi:hypothetical protein
MPVPVIIRQKMVYPKGFSGNGYPLCSGGFAMKPKGIENVTIHAFEHDIALTQDIIFDYTKTGKISPVLNLNY